MGRRHYASVHGRVPYAGPQPGTSIALVVPEETNLSGALCTAVAPEVFFPHADESEMAEQLAKRICSACPVRMTCLNGAIQRDERFGVFGGLTTAERDTLTERPGGCGTDHGYKRHILAEDPPCRACREARAAASAIWRANGKARKAGQEGSHLEAAA